VNAEVQTRDTILSATMSLIKYLEGHTSKVVITNQLENIGTPDALEVIPHIEALHATLKTHENTDLTELTKVMQAILDETSKIPKELPEQQEFKQIDHTEQFKALTKAIEAVQTVIKEQKLIVEAPVVNVDSPNVQVDAPDLKPLQTGFKDVVAAVKKIVIPEYKTDTDAVQKLLTTSNKLLKSILEKPVGGGGGGSSRASPYSDAAGIPSFPVLINGAVPTSGAPVTARYDYLSSTIIYTGEALVGTDDAATGWRITKFDLSDKSNASGKIATNVSWINRAAGTYN